MRKKEDLIKEFISKVKELKKHNNLYYNKDNPVISDSEYDLLKKKIIKLEQENQFLKKIVTAENIVGAMPSNKFKKVKHLVPMLSLSNAFELKDMNDFLKKINNFLKSDSDYIQLFSEPKIRAASKI